ncbi:hypothetical protein [Leminorella grimontii]|uniref:hypothetical protein n=1 Tax=Leminorella grimontii TaxID=82981 RepID=UPI00321FA168
MYKSKAALAVFILAFASGAWANMRAAINHIELPSSPLTLPQGQKPMPQLVVQSETLDVDCDYDRCWVEAVYHITSSADATLDFAFIMPANTPVEAKVAGKYSAAKVTLERDAPEAPDPSYWNRCWSASECAAVLSLYRASFTGKVFKGKNTVEVAYFQPITHLEKAYGYFTSSRSIEVFAYEMAPLKEWQLADDFTLKVTLSALRERPERDGGSSLFRSRSVNCILPGQKVEKNGEYLNLEATLDQNFPDRLVCNIGDSDLIDGNDYN